MLTSIRILVIIDVNHVTIKKENSSNLFRLDNEKNKRIGVNMNEKSNSGFNAPTHSFWRICM